MEEVVEISFRLVAKGVYLLARCALWLIFELCFEVVGWWAGWCLCRVATLNTFPPQALSQHKQASPGVALLVCWVGVLGLIGLCWGLAAWLGSGLS